MGLVVSSTGGFVVSTTCLSRPRKCHAKAPIANRSKPPNNHGKIEGGVAGARDAYFAPEALRSSRIPVSPRYLENPEGRAPVTLLFCEVRRLASPEASRPCPAVPGQGHPERPAQEGPSSFSSRLRRYLHIVRLRRSERTASCHQEAK